MAIDFTFTTAQRELQLQSRKFARDVLAGAIACETLATPEERFLATKPIYETIVSAGYLRKCIPAPAGGELANRVPEAPPVAQGGTGEGQTPAAGAAPQATTATAANPAATPAAPVIHVRTDVLDVDISTRGGTLVRVDLPAYPQVKGETTPVRLENHDDAQSLYELQSGLTGPEGAEYPNHLAVYTPAKSDYALDGANEVRVPLTWSEGGVAVTKTFVFRRGQYHIDLDYSVHNAGSAPWSARQYAQILRNDPPTKRSYFNVESYAFHGPAIWDGTKFRRLDASDAQDSRLSLDVRDGWVAALQHHFVSAIVPPRGAPWHFALGVQGPEYLLSATGPEQTIAPGATGEFDVALFAGPKLQGQLEATSPELGRVTDYGRLVFDPRTGRQPVRQVFLLHRDRRSRPVTNIPHYLQGRPLDPGARVYGVDFAFLRSFYQFSEETSIHIGNLVGYEHGSAAVPIYLDVNTLAT